MSDMGAVEQVGARLVLLDADTFRAQLEAATEAMAAFNREQERTAQLAADTSKVLTRLAKTTTASADANKVASDAAATQASTMEDLSKATTDAAAASVDMRDATRSLSRSTKTASASATDLTAALTNEAGAVKDAAVGVQEATANTDALAASTDRATAATDAAAASQDKLVASSKAATTAVAGSDAAMVAGAGKILKWGAAIGAVVGYEGIKKFLSYNQAVKQLGVNAGISANQLRPLSKGFMGISDATGMAATNVANMAYYLASANPLAKTSTKSLLDMSRQAAQMVVMEGASADPVATARAYGAIVSNQMSLSAGKRPLAYGTKGGTAINQWLNAVTGHGDVTLGALAQALGTGILPMAKTFGLSLNQVGAMFDVLSPAMNASSAATRLKTALSMMGAPTASSRQAYELFGANATTPGAILRTKGPQAMLSYLAALTTGRVTGKTFANAFYGSGIGTPTGGTKGVGTGASEYLRVMGFTPAQVGIMESKGGIARFGLMTPKQLASVGFAPGTTGTVAMKTVQADLISQMFGGGHTGAAVMQLLNERSTLATKQKQIVAAENPVTYGQQLKLAFSEPIVTVNRLKQAFENLTIRIGQDITPTVMAFGNDLLSVGKWFGKNSWALKALGDTAAAVVAGAAGIKAIAMTEKVVQFGKSVVTGVTGTSTLVAAGNTLNAAGVSLQTAADRLMGSSSVAGADTSVAGAGTTAAAENAAGGALLGGKSLSEFARGAAMKGAVTVAAVLAENQFLDPAVAKVLGKKSPMTRLTNDMVRGATFGAYFGNIVPIPGVGAGVGAVTGGVVGFVAGGGLDDVLGLHAKPYQTALLAYARAHPGKVPHSHAGGAGLGTPSKNGRPSLGGGMALTPSLASATNAASYARVAALYGMTPKEAALQLAPYDPMAARGLLEGTIAKQMGVPTSSVNSFMSSLGAASKLKGTSAQDTAAGQAAARLVAVGVARKDAADHYHMSAAQITAASRHESATLEQLMTTSASQKEAAGATETGSAKLTTAATDLSTAALKLLQASNNAVTAFAPANIHALAVAGTKQAVARK